MSCQTTASAATRGQVSFAAAESVLSHMTAVGVAPTCRVLSLCSDIMSSSVARCSHSMRSPSPPHSTHPHQSSSCSSILPNISKCTTLPHSRRVCPALSSVRVSSRAPELRATALVTSSACLGPKTKDTNFVSFACLPTCCCGLFLPVLCPHVAVVYFCLCCGIFIFLAPNWTVTEAVLHRLISRPDFSTCGRWPRAQHLPVQSPTAPPPVVQIRRCRC